MPKDKIEFLIIGAVTFLAGIVANIIVPARRGLLGFLNSIIVSVFVGGIAGFCSSHWGADLPVTVLVSAFFGVMADRILTAILVRSTRIEAINIHGGTNQINQGENVNGGQK